MFVPLSRGVDVGERGGMSSDEAGEGPLGQIVPNETHKEAKWRV